MIAKKGPATFFHCVHVLLHFLEASGKELIFSCILGLSNVVKMFRRLAILSSPPVKFPPSCLVDLIKHVRDAEDTDDEEIGFSDILFYGYSFRNVFTEAADEVLQMQMQSEQNLPTRSCL